jgi:hypothetical protein
MSTFGDRGVFGSQAVVGIRLAPGVWFQVKSPLALLMPPVVGRGVDLVECRRVPGEVVSEDVAAERPVATARLFGRLAL